MDRKQERLISRGFIKEGAEFDFRYLSYSDIVILLKSNIATERTLGARLLRVFNNETTVNILIEALKIEHKLYSKIEICNTLSSFGEISVKYIVDCLGEIGNNQHVNIDDTEFKKDNYPLPRDIASRTLIRIGEKALPELLKSTIKVSCKQLSELIDAIGYICFYNYSKEVYPVLIELFAKFEGNNLIKWKIYRAMSGIPESLLFLEKQYKIEEKMALKIEIERSVRIINKRTPFSISIVS